MDKRVRDPILVLILDIVTFGIYGLYLIYSVSDEVMNYTGDNSINPTLELILCLFFWPYTIYWAYKYSKLIYNMEESGGIPYPSDVSLPACLLCVFNLTCVSLMLIQSEANKVWNAHP